MKVTALGGLVLVALGVVSCSGPPATVSVVDAAPEAPAEVAVSEPPAEGGSGGASSDDNPAPDRLTGLPGIDQARDLTLRILDARGTGRQGGRPVAAGQASPLTTGEWLLSDEGSEYEITLRSALLPDGIIRLGGRSAFLVEPPSGDDLPRFRLFAGQGAFYLPDTAQAEVVVLTPAGPLVTHGAVFTVTVSPDSQVLVTCREGAVFLTGTQNAEARPGQVLVADRLGRGRVYTMTPNEALVFADRWLKVMTEEAAPILTAVLPRRLAEWKAAIALHDLEQARFLALWFREARPLLGGAVPGPEAWSGTLDAEVRPSVWAPLPPAPGLLGELP